MFCLSVFYICVRKRVHGVRYVFWVCVLDTHVLYGMVYTIFYNKIHCFYISYVHIYIHIYSPPPRQVPQDWSKDSFAHCCSFCIICILIEVAYINVHRGVVEICYDNY